MARKFALLAAIGAACLSVAAAHTTFICFDNPPVGTPGVRVSVHTYNHGGLASPAILHLKTQACQGCGHLPSLTLPQAQYGGLPQQISQGGTADCANVLTYQNTEYYWDIVDFSCSGGDVFYLWTQSPNAPATLAMQESQAVQWTCPEGGFGGSGAFPADKEYECNAAHTYDLTATEAGAGATEVTPGSECNSVDDSQSYDGPQSSTCPNTFSFTRHHVVTESDCNSGHTPEVFSDDQEISVVDTTAPALSNLPADITVGCGVDITDLSITGAPTASDVCQGTLVPSYTDAITSGSSVCTGLTTTRSWVVTDGCGNTSPVYQQHITVQSGTPPTIQAPPSTTHECTSADISVEANGSPTVGGGCGEVSVTFEDSTAPGCGKSYIIIRTWTATDNCGTQASAVQQISVTDTTAPTLSGVPADATVECDAVPAPATVTASDGCDDAPTVSYTQTRTNGHCAEGYTLTRTWTATDACGNSASQSQTITVQDTTAPTLSGVPSDVTVECDSVPEPATVTASDNCDGAPTVSYNQVRTDGSCPHTYTLTRTWTGTDCSGNAFSESQTITVQDTTAPTQDAVDSQLCVFPEHGSQKNRFACFTGVTANVAGGFASYSDNCGDTTIHSVTCSSTAPVSSGSGKSGSSKSSTSKSGSSSSRRLGSESEGAPKPCKPSSGSGSSGGRVLRALKGKGSSSASASNSKSASGSSSSGKPADGFDIFYGFEDQPDCIYYAQHDMVCVRAKVTGAEKDTGRTYTIGFTGEDECGHTTDGSRSIWVPRNEAQLDASGLAGTCTAPTHKMKCGDAAAPFPIARESAETESAAPAPQAGQAATTLESNTPAPSAEGTSAFSIAIIGGGAVVAVALAVVGARMVSRRSDTTTKVATIGAAEAVKESAPAPKADGTAAPSAAWA